MPSPCYELAKKLKAAIDARMLGDKATSVSHRGRSVEFGTTPLPQLVAYYNQVRAGCPEALADPELIAIAPPDQPFAIRGPAAIYLGKGSL